MIEDLISIVVPVYNAEKFIEKTINTVEEQSYKNWELILVNDCSTDNSKKIIEEKLKKNNKIKLINLSKNSGPALARNKGIELAEGRFLCFLDADDLWDINKLEMQIKFMKENNCAFSFTSYEFADENGNPIGKKVHVPKKINYKQALKNTTISTITVMLDIDKLGKDLIQMPNVLSEDTATWWKILKQINYAYGIDYVFSYYRRHKQSLSANKFIALKRTWNLYRNIENLSFSIAFLNFCWYVVNAVKRRI